LPTAAADNRHSKKRLAYFYDLRYNAGVATISTGQRSKKKMERIEYAMKILAELHTHEAVSRKLQEKFQISPNNASWCINEARKLWQTRPPVDVEARRAEMADAFRQFYTTCMEKGVYGPAGHALRNLACLYGLPVSANVIVKPDSPALGIPFASSDPEKVRSRLTELLDKHSEAIQALKAEPPKGSN
jgi:hypothetical protein